MQSILHVIIRHNSNLGVFYGSFFGNRVGDKINYYMHITINDNKLYARFLVRFLGVFPVVFGKMKRNMVYKL